MDVRGIFPREQETDRVAALRDEVFEPSAEDGAGLLGVDWDGDDGNASVPCLRTFALVYLGPRVVVPLALQDDCPILA